MANEQTIKDFEETLSKLKTKLAVAESETDKLKKELLEFDIDVENIDIEEAIHNYNLLLDECDEKLSNMMIDIEEVLNGNKKPQEKS